MKECFIEDSIIGGAFILREREGETDPSIMFPLKRGGYGRKERSLQRRHMQDRF